jgi:pimeloyl-ACP methyl ester carboxylesterase
MPGGGIGQVDPPIALPAAATIQIRPGQDDLPAVGAVQAEGQGPSVGVEGGDDAAAAVGHPQLGDGVLTAHDPVPDRQLEVLELEPLGAEAILGGQQLLAGAVEPVDLQLPWLPERLVAARDFQALRRALGRQPTRPGAFTAQDIDRYVTAAAQPGALRAAVNYYRAAVRANPLALAHTLRRVDIPTLVIWGEQDRYLGRELAEPDHVWVPEVRVERIAEASHWVQADAPERVNQLMVESFSPSAANGQDALWAMSRGVVGFEVDPRCLLAAVVRGDAASIAGWFELGHGPLGQVAALA